MKVKRIRVSADPRMLLEEAVSIATFWAVRRATKHDERQIPEDVMARIVEQMRIELWNSLDDAGIRVTR